MKARSLVIIAVAVAALVIASVTIWSALGGTLFPPDSDKVTFDTYNPYSGSEGTWYKGQLHSHSTKSDGDLSPAEAAARYAGLGFAFVALSDHHYVTKLKGSGILVLGQEYSKGSTESGLEYNPHMNGINISYGPSESLSQQQRIDNIVSQRGIVVLNHPTTMFFSYDLGDLTALRNYTAMEIYNGYSDGVLAGNPVALWDDILSTGRIVWGTAGDDAHAADDYGQGWIVVKVTGKLTTASVISAIKRGSFYASQGPTVEDIRFNGSTFSVSSPGADSISFYGRDGRHLKTEAGGHSNYTIDGSEGYVRAEINDDGLKAWSQPVFVGTSPTATQVSSDSIASEVGSWFVARSTL